MNEMEKDSNRKQNVGLAFLQHVFLSVKYSFSHTLQHLPSTLCHLLSPILHDGSVLGAEHG